MKALFILVNTNFWKSFLGPFFAFCFPLIFVGILGTILGYENILGSTLTIPATAVSLTALPQAIFEFKRSSLLKRIGVSPIRPWMFLALIWCYYVVIMFLATFTTLLVGVILYSNNFHEGRETGKAIQLIVAPIAKNFTPPVFAPSVKEILDSVNWGGLIFATLMNIFVGTSIGLFVASIAKSTLTIIGIGVPILIISQFLSPQAFPIIGLFNSKIMWNIGFVNPFRFSNGLFLESWSGPFTKDVILENNEPVRIILKTTEASNIFDISTPFMISDPLKEFKSVKIYGKTLKILNLTLPFVFTTVFFGLSLRTFKWSVR